ncbi:MAG: cytochrome P450, partial [Acidobacteria bacterium]|nr:cytochrome P450 [Acidobacteriota bacterium]
MSDTRGFIQGVASLALTAVLVAGVPVFLITRFGWPFDDIVNALTDQLASDATVVSTLLTATLVIVAWAAWIQITWAIAVEAVALIQGRSAKRIPILPGLQQGAAQLVASCALVVTSFTPAAPAVGAPITPHQPAHITLQVVADTPDNAANVGAAPATSTTSQPRYTVTRGDTFWAIAERLLGDGLRWQEIRDLNLNHTMDDGTVITSPYIIHRHRDFWDNPEGFDPERFAPGVERSHPWAYFPFAGGNHVCLGNRFAMLEGVLIGSMLFRV